MPSSVTPERQPPSRIRVAPEDVTLVVWPLGQRPLESFFLISTAAVVSVLVGWWTRQPIVAGLVAAALAVILWRTWLPVTVEIGVMGVTQTALGRSRRIPWSSIRGFEVDSGGVLLTPDTNLTPLAALRGLYLPWPQDLDKRQKVLASVEYYMQSPY